MILPGSREVVVDHEHVCSVCQAVWPGYNPNCKKNKVTLCANCLAEQFPAAQATKQ